MNSHFPDHPIVGPENSYSVMGGQIIHGDAVLRGDRKRKVFRPPAVMIIIFFEHPFYVIFNFFWRMFSLKSLQRIYNYIPCAE